MNSNQLNLWGESPTDKRLRWSLTRERRLRECLRKYWLFHHASRPPHHDARARELYVLRSLRTRQMWIGEVVHAMIERLLAAWRRHEDVPVEAVIERGTRTMRAQYAESLQGLYWDRPQTAVGLIEHEYHEQVPREEWRAGRDRMEQCLRHFYALPFLARLRQMPDWRWLAVESSGSFDQDGATVVVKPDLAWRDEDDHVVMVDWKTGSPRPDDEHLQLSVYGVFAQRAWRLGDDHLRAIAAYLATGETREWRVGQSDLQAAQKQIQASLSRMRAFDRLAENLRTDDPPEFPRTDDLTACRRCGFRRACGRVES